MVCFDVSSQFTNGLIDEAVSVIRDSSRIIWKAIVDKTIHQLPFNLSLKPLSNFIQPFFMSMFQPILKLYPYVIKLYIKYQTHHQTSY